MSTFKEDCLAASMSIQRVSTWMRKFSNRTQEMYSPNEAQDTMEDFAKSCISLVTAIKTTTWGGLIEPEEIGESWLQIIEDVVGSVPRPYEGASEAEDQTTPTRPYKDYAQATKSGDASSKPLPKTPKPSAKGKDRQPRQPSPPPPRKLSKYDPPAGRGRGGRGRGGRGGSSSRGRGQTPPPQPNVSSGFYQARTFDPPQGPPYASSSSSRGAFGYSARDVPMTSGIEEITEEDQANMDAFLNQQEDEEMEEEQVPKVRLPQAVPRQATKKPLVSNLPPAVNPPARPVWSTVSRGKGAKTRNMVPNPIQPGNSGVGKTTQKSCDSRLQNDNWQCQS